MSQDTPETDVNTTQVPKRARASASEPEYIKMKSNRAEEVLEEIKTQTKDDQGMGETWKDLVLEGQVMITGKTKAMGEVMKWIRSKCKLPQDMNSSDVRAKELDLGNLLQIVSQELAAASYHRDLMAERKKDYLAYAKDRKKSTAVIESELSKYNEEYKYVRGMWMSGELNYKFWKNMHEMITETLDRLKHVGITLASEARVDQFLNQDVSNKRGQRI